MRAEFTHDEQEPDGNENLVDDPIDNELNFASLNEEHRKVLLPSGLDETSKGEFIQDFLEIERKSFSASGMRMSRLSFSRIRSFICVSIKRRSRAFSSIFIHRRTRGETEYRKYHE